MDPAEGPPAIRHFYRQDAAELDLSAGTGIAVREFTLAEGEADYLPYVAGKAIGIVEAKRVDLDEFVELFRRGKRHLRKATWSEENAQGRWRSFTYDELAKRDKLNLDIFWLKDDTLEDSESLPDPDLLADEISDDLETALDLFRTVARRVKE